MHRDDRQSKVYYAEERKRLKELKETTGTLDDTALLTKSKIVRIGAGPRADAEQNEPTWVNITMGGRNLTVLVDSQGSVLGSKAAEVDLRKMVDDVL